MSKKYKVCNDEKVKSFLDSKLDDLDKKLLLVKVDNLKADVSDNSVSIICEGKVNIRLLLLIRNREICISKKSTTSINNVIESMRKEKMIEGNNN